MREIFLKKALIEGDFSQKQHSLKDFVTFGRKLVAYGSAPAGKKREKQSTSQALSSQNTSIGC